MIKRLMLRASVPLSLVFIWSVANRLRLIEPLYLPSIEDVLNELVNFFRTRGLLDVTFTLYRALISLVISSVLAIPLGLALGIDKKLYIASEVVIDFMRSVPSSAFFPLFLLFFGIGEQAKIAIGSFTTFWVILINSIYGVWNCPKERIKTGKIFKASSFQLFREIVFFDALPQIFVGLRLSLSLSLIIVIVTEMFFGTKFGLGRKIYDSYVSYDTAQLFAMIAVVGSVGYLLNKVFVYAEREIIHWVSR